MPRENARELLEIINDIDPARLNPEHVVFENWWHPVHDLGTSYLGGWKMRTRLGTKDEEPVYLVCFQHKAFNAAAVTVEFPQLPASGVELLAGLRQVCEIYSIITRRLKLMNHRR